MSEKQHLGWRGQKVRNQDGRTGVIRSEYIGFGHVVLSIAVDGGEKATVQLNMSGRDQGEPGWQWLCENFSNQPSWLPLGDHSDCEVEPATRLALQGADHV